MDKIKESSVECKEKEDQDEAAENYASNEGYPKSDKEHFETTYWTQHNIAANGFKAGIKYASLNKTIDDKPFNKADYNKGYDDGYRDATNEAREEIKEHYHPNK